MKTRTVWIAEEALQSIKDLVREVKSAHDENETGGYLAGIPSKRGVKILHALGPGPDAVRTPAHFEPDYAYTAKEFARLDRGKLKVVGAWHLHCVNGLSGGDRRTLETTSVEYSGFIALVVCRSTEEIRLFQVQDGELVELEWKVLKVKTTALDFSRTSKLVSHSVLEKKTVYVPGCGSGASSSVPFLGRAGVGAFILKDDEVLERVNIVRHIGKLHQLGMYKVDILADELRLINPDVKVFPSRKKLDENSKDEAEKFMKRASLTLACTGSSLANHLLNEISVRLKKPVVYAGVFERASGGFVLLSVPSLKSSPCFNCIYDYTSSVQSDSNTAVEDQARRYGVKADDLHAQQGLYVDIGFVALLQAKVALTALVHGAGKALSVLPGNLAVWNTQRLSASWLTVQRRKDCAVCNREGWLKSRARTSEAEMQKEN